MGQPQSKDELVYQQVNDNNVEAIKSLCSQGAGLEWIDKERRTPLIVACMNPTLYNVAKTLIGLGANVNAYRPGRQAGTPLHHAANRGLEDTVKLLLSHGANVLVKNDDYQTPLDVARASGFGNVVRIIESHICLFSGWLREVYWPGFLELLSPQLASRKVWVTVLPCASRSLAKPLKLELTIYSSLQDAQPCKIIALWKANMEDPNFNHHDPVVVIGHNSTISRGRRRRKSAYAYRDARKIHIKLASQNEDDKQQLARFCNACKGILEETLPVTATAPPAADDSELVTEINAPIQSDMETPPVPMTIPTSEPTSSTAFTFNTTSHGPHGTNGSLTLADPLVIANEVVIDNDGPISYPSIDSTILENISAEKKEDVTCSSCVICLDAPVEGACIPCGHMAGCMSCLNEITNKKWGCPVCRTAIHQIVRLYAV